MVTGAKADDAKDALLKAGLTDEILAQGEPALDSILNKVELSQVQRVRLKQWYRKNMTAKAAPPPGEGAKSAEAEKPKLTPEQEKVIKLIEDDIRKKQTILVGVENWLLAKLKKQQDRNAQKQVPLVKRVAQSWRERWQVAMKELKAHHQQKIMETEARMHVMSAAYDFHPTESQIWLEMYMQRFLGYRRYTPKSPNTSSFDGNTYVLAQAIKKAHTEHVHRRDELFKKLGIEAPPPLISEDTRATLHASGVEALSFFRGEIDANRPDLLRAGHALQRISLAVLALFIVMAAVLVVVMGERLRGRKNGILQYLRAWRLGAVKLSLNAPNVLHEAQQRHKPVHTSQPETPRTWRKLV